MYLLLVVCVDAREGHFPARERHDLVGRCWRRDALSIHPALDAPLVESPAIGQGLESVLFDVGLEVHITNGDSSPATCQALFVIFFTRDGARYNSASIYPSGRSP